MPRPAPARRARSAPAAALALLLAQGCADAPVLPTAAPAPPGAPAAPPAAVVRRWSDPASWPGGAVPAAGAEVTVPAGTELLLDVSPPPLRGLRVDGTLTFDDRDLALTADWIRVAGTLRVGSEARPFQRRAVTTLTGTEADEGALGLASNALAVAAGGTLELHGRRRVGWTRLAATARAGATEIVLDHDVDWAPGDQLVLAPTDFEPTQYDEVTVAAVAGRRVTLAAPLRFTHWGELQTVAGRTLDERGEVGLLTRNVTFRGDSAACGRSGYCAHVIAFRGGQMRVSGVELRHVGQKFRLARYPIHWHMMAEVPGQYARDNSIWRSFNRCVTVHGSHDATVAGNVCHDHLGHGYFLEDGVEQRNTIAGNLGVYGRTPAAAERLLASDSRPATFWITHPDNAVRGNVAAGSTGWGFWYALPEHPTGQSATAAVWPRTTPLREFRDNVAHSNRTGGLNVDEGPRPDGTTETTSYAPRENPAAASPAVAAEFRGFSAWKHRGRGVWLRGRAHRLVDAVLADNGIGATFASSDSYLQDALVVGESANNATPHAAGFPVRGYEFYDGTVGAQRVTFANFVAGARGPASALGFNRTNAFPLSTLNFAEGLRFERANQAWLLAPAADKDGDKAQVFLDRDGSVTGAAGRYVVADVPLLVHAGCARRAEWNAHVCAGGYARLSLSSAAGEDAAPADVVRDDQAALRLAGSGNRLTSLSLSVPVGRRYAVAPAGALSRPRVSLSGMRPGEWVRLSIPYPTASFSAWRDNNVNNRLTPAATLADLDASAGDKYFYAAGVLHLKPVAQPGRDAAAVAVDPR